MNRSIREKQHRLPKEAYRGHQIVSFTTNLKDRRPALLDLETFTVMEALLIDAATTYRSDALIYLFMPDHAHIILAAKETEADVLSAMKRFKQRSNYWLAHHRPNVRWHKGFHDHILRCDEEIQRHVRYILNNPIRAGIIDDWRRYPSKGSTVYDLSSWSLVLRGDAR